MGINVLLLPFVLRFLDDDALGIWYVFSSINTLIMLLDFGFTPTVARNIAYTWSGAEALQATGVRSLGTAEESRGDLFVLVLRTCKVIYGALAAIATPLLFLLGSLYVLRVSPETMADYFLVAWWVYAAGVLCNLYFNYSSAYLRGIGAVAENAKAQTCAKALQLVGTAVLLMMGLGILGTSIAYLASCIIMRLMLNYYFYHFEGVRELTAVRRQVFIVSDVTATIKTVWHNAWRDGLVSLSMYCCLQANTLICSYALGLSATGTYGLVVQIANAIASIASVPYSTVQPKLQELALLDRKNDSHGLFSWSFGLYMLIQIILCAGFLLVGPGLIRALGKDFDMGTLMMAVLLLYMALYKGNTLFISGISNFNEIPYASAYVISGFLSVALSAAFAMLTPLGLWSLIIPPLLTLCCYNIWKWPKVLLGKYDTSVSSFIRHCAKELTVRGVGAK